MSYQILARRSRPQTFADVVGQESVVRALRNALSEGRIAQAYLFSGIRGVGKTSVARILAKALNCSEGPADEPCNECESCREITAGASIDVIEVDAATYSKVDQIRDLTDGLQYGPSGGRSKVVIIDEIHRLSRQAFDALLKIVEEPPSHLVFIFATTDVDAVPATIVSRCQEFSFRRVPAELLTSHLERLCESEGLRVESGSLRRIARAAEGSVRDAVALLDQLATLGEGTIDDAEVARLLGGLDLSALAGLFQAVAAGERASVSERVAAVRNAGRDPRRIYTELLGYAREALHLAVGVPADAIDLPPEERDELAALVSDWGFENVLRLVQHLLESEPLLRQADSPFLALELALLRAAELPRLAALEVLLGGKLPDDGGAERLPRAEPNAGEDQQTTIPSTADAAREPPAEAAESDAGADPPSAESEDTAAATGGGDTNDADAGSGDRDDREHDQPAEEPRLPQEPENRDGRVENAGLSFVEAVRVSKPSLAAHLARSRVRVDGSRLVIEHAPDDQLLARAWERAGNQKVIRKAARELLGEAAEVALAESSSLAATGPANGSDDADIVDGDRIAGHPQVQAVLDIFNGEVTSVTSSSGGRDEPQDKQ